MEKLLKILEAWEAQINSGLKSLFSHRPTFLSTEKLLAPFRKIKELMLRILKAIAEFFINLGNQIAASFARFKKNLNYNLRMVTQTLNVFKNQGFKKGLEFAQTEISNRLSRLVRWIEQLGPKKFFLLSLFIMFAILNAFHLISSSKKFVISLPFMQDTPPVQPENKIPDYYNFREKKIIMNEVKFPLFMNGPKRMKHLNLDLTVEFTNRTAQMFFLQNRIIFQDHLQMTLEPMDPQFSLTDEGKNIQRQKIKREIEDVLQERGIAGEEGAERWYYQTASGARIFTFEEDRVVEVSEDRRYLP